MRPDSFRLRLGLHSTDAFMLALFLQAAAFIHVLGCTWQAWLHQPVMYMYFLDPIVAEPDKVTIQHIHQPKPHKLFFVLRIHESEGQGRNSLQSPHPSTLFPGATTHVLDSDCSQTLLFATGIPSSRQ